MRKKKKIAILGAGLSGLSLAWHLQRRGIKCLLFEKEPQAGGLCRSKHIKDFTFDYDGHLLHFRHKYSFELVNSLLKGNLVKHKRNAWVYCCRRYVRYPFQANLFGLPSKVVKECLVGFANLTQRHDRCGSEISFNSWIDHNFGRGIAKYFMVPYNSKFWTVSPRHITSEWVKGFIPVPSLRQVVEGTIEESHRQLGYSSYFWYPQSGGIGVLPLALSRQITGLHTSSEVASIDFRKKELKFKGGGREDFDILINTIPLPELASLALHLPCKVKDSLERLRWNSVYNLNLGVDNPKDNDHRHWIYFPQKNISFFRVGFAHNFSSCVAPRGKNSLYTEVSYSREKPINKTKIVGRIIEDLVRMKFLNCKSDILAADINDIAYGYPIYDRNYSRSRKAVFEFLSSCDSYCCGRYGSWKYMSMEDVMLEAKLFSEAMARRL